MKRDILILGAGPAGLSSALSLTRRGERVILVEREGEVGGMCRTIRRDGFVFDTGGHRFITKDETVLRFVKDLMGEELQERPRESKIFLQGRYFQYPLNGADIVASLPFHLILKAGGDYIIESVKRSLGRGRDETLEEWVKGRFGKTLYEIYFKPYSEKLWGIPCREISSDFASQRISLLNLLDVALRLVGKGAGEPKTYATRFLYPRGGIGRIGERMAEEIKRGGGEILLNSTPSRLEARRGGIEAVRIEGGGGGITLHPSHVISTIPLTELVRLLPVESGAMSLSDRLDFRSVLFLNIVLDMEKVSENTWIYIPEREYLVFRIQEPKNWHPENAPAGKTSLILELACDYMDRVWQEEEGGLIRRGLDDLERLGFPLFRHVESSFITRIRYAYPVYRLGYRAILSALLPHLDRFTNLLSCGRQGLFRYNNMDHSIAMGMAAADWVMGERKKGEIYGIALERDSFE